MSLTDHAHAGDEKVAELFRALGSPLRVAIVRQLLEGEKCVHQLVEALDVAQPRVSQHLNVLRSARVVSAERSGREMHYSLADAHVRHLVADALSHSNESED